MTTSKHNHLSSDFATLPDAFSKQYSNVSDNITALSGALHSLKKEMNAVISSESMAKVITDRKDRSFAADPYSGFEAVMNKINMLIGKIPKDEKGRNSGNDHIINLLHNTADALNLVKNGKKKVDNSVSSIREIYASAFKDSVSLKEGVNVELKTAVNNLKSSLQEAEGYLDGAIEDLQSAAKLAIAQDVKIAGDSYPVACHTHLQGSDISRLIGDMSMFNAIKQGSPVAQLMNEVTIFLPVLVAATV